MYKSCNLVSNICVHASAEAKQPIAIIIPHEPNLRHVLAQRSMPGVDATASLPDLCHNQAVQELVLKECNVVGKKNDFKAMEMLEAVIMTAEEWTPESGLVTAAQKVQRSKIAKHFQEEIQVRVPSMKVDRADGGRRRFIRTSEGEGVIPTRGSCFTLSPSCTFPIFF